MKQTQKKHNKPFFPIMRHKKDESKKIIRVWIEWCGYYYSWEGETKERKLVELKV